MKETNFTKKRLAPFGRSMLVAMMLVALIMGPVDLNAQSCTCLDNPTIGMNPPSDARTPCQTTVSNMQLAGCNNFMTVELVKASDFVVWPYTLCDGSETFENVSEYNDFLGTTPAATVDIYIPGKYKYEIQSETGIPGCWKYFTAEEKTGPICAPDGDEEPEVQICGETDVEGGAVLRADPSGVDDLAAELVSCYVLEEYGAEGLEPWFDKLDNGDFKDCEGVEVDQVYQNRDIVVSTCIPDWFVSIRQILADNGVTDVAVPSSIPDGWEVCEVRIRSWYAKDKRGTDSELCGQVLYVIRPTEIFLDMRVITECNEDPDLAVTNGLIGPYLVDAVNGRDIITCPNHSGEKMVITDGEFCKYTATSDEDNQLLTCKDRPGCDGLLKTAIDWTLWDWCKDQFPANVTLFETYMGDPDNNNTMEPVPGVKEVTQIVSEEDRTPPVFPGNFTKPSIWPNLFDCSVKVIFSDIIADDLCVGDIEADFSVIISGPTGYNIVGTTEEYTKTEAKAGIMVEKGSTYEIKASAEDCCNPAVHQSYTGLIELDDTEPPICRAIPVKSIPVVKTDPHDSEDDHRVGARILATSLDNGSYDNCSEITIQVRDRNAVAPDPNAEWRDFVQYDWTTEEFENLSIDDATGEPTCLVEVWLELQITDADNNISTCFSDVTLFDDSAPEFVGDDDCEIFSVIGCNEVMPDWEVPAVWGTCYTITHVDGGEKFDHCPREFVDPCDRDSEHSPFQNVVEWKSRTYTVSKTTPYGTLTDEFTQYIIVQNVRDETFTFPWDHKIVCDENGNYSKPDPLTLAEILNDQGCKDRWQMVVEEVEYSDSDNSTQESCRTFAYIYKFRRICGVDENDVDDSKQIDKDCGDDEIDDFELLLEPATHGGTDKQIVIIYKGQEAIETDDADCATDPDFGLPHRLGDEYWVQEGYFEYTQIIKIVDVLAPEVEFTLDNNFPSIGCDPLALDCATTLSLSFQFTISDICSELDFTTLNATVDPDPSNFILSAVTDNLDGTFTYTVDGTGLSAQAYTLSVDVSDNCGNTITPAATQVVDVPTCCPSLNIAANIAGKFTNQNDDDIEDVMVKLMEDGVEIQSLMFNGAFNYSVPMHTEVTIKPEKPLGYMNGISTGDLVKMQRHILKIVPLTSAYQVIAADINNDDEVDVRDMLHISRLILGIYDEFPNSYSWRFVSKDHVFTNPSEPWGFPEAVNYQELTQDVNIDFIGVKIGDLTGNASPSFLNGDGSEQSIGKLQIAIEDKVISAGERYTVSFKADDFTDFAGYQFTLGINDALTFESFEAGQLPNLGEANFGLNRLDNGIITTSWSNAEGITLQDGAELFSMTFTANETVRLSQVLSVNSTFTKAEAYNNDLEVFDVEALFNRAIDTEFELFQNRPNPFSGETVIGFNMPKAGRATLRVMDIAGKVVQEQSGEFARGYNEISLSKSDLQATGVLYYQLDSETHSATKKMIVIE